MARGSGVPPYELLKINGDLACEQTKNEKRLSNARTKIALWTNEVSTPRGGAPRGLEISFVHKAILVGAVLEKPLLKMAEPRKALSYKGLTLKYTCTDTNFQ